MADTPGAGSNQGGGADGGRPVDLAGLAFGNLNSAGKIEGSVLEQDALNSLGALAGPLGIGIDLNALAGEDGRGGGGAGGAGGGEEDEGPVGKADDAQDYEDIQLSGDDEDGDDDADKAEADKAAGGGKAGEGKAADGVPAEAAGKHEAKPAAQGPTAAPAGTPAADAAADGVLTRPAAAAAPVALPSLGVVVGPRGEEHILRFGEVFEQAPVEREPVLRSAARAAARAARVTEAEEGEEEEGGGAGEPPMDEEPLLAAPDLEAAGWEALPPPRTSRERRRELRTEDREEEEEGGNSEEEGGEEGEEQEGGEGQAGRRAAAAMREAGSTSRGGAKLASKPSGRAPGDKREAKRPAAVVPPPPAPLVPPEGQKEAASMLAQPSLALVHPPLGRAAERGQEPGAASLGEGLIIDGWEEEVWREACGDDSDGKEAAEEREEEEAEPIGTDSGIQDMDIAASNQGPQQQQQQVLYWQLVQADEQARRTARMADGSNGRPPVLFSDLLAPGSRAAAAARSAAMGAQASGQQLASVPSQHQHQQQQQHAMMVMQMQMAGGKAGGAAAAAAEEAAATRLLRMDLLDVPAAHQEEAKQLVAQALARRYNLDLADSGWEDAVQWDGWGAGPGATTGVASAGPPAITAPATAAAASGATHTHNGAPAGGVVATLFDLNDAGLFFEAAPMTDNAVNNTVTMQLERAAATVLPQPPKPPVWRNLHPNEGEAAAELARLNVSKDYGQGARRKAERGAGMSKHSILALGLMTLPTVLPLEELVSFHRPRSLWVPPHMATKGGKASAAAAAAAASGVVTLRLVSMSGGVSQAFKDLAVDNTKLAEIWVMAKSHKFKAAAEDPPPVFVSPGMPPKMLNTDVTLSRSGMRRQEEGSKASVTAVFRHLLPLASRIVNTVPSEDSATPVRPPAAFTKKKDLSVVQGEGHVLLLEYLEETPLLLSQPGMGVRLCTYYKKTSATDDAYHKLRAAVGGGGPEGERAARWRLGNVHPLLAQAEDEEARGGGGDESPFLGTLRPGASQLAVDANLFRAPAVPYDPKGSDFLLVREVVGTLRLRELTGALAVGQQEPGVRVPYPGSKELKEYEEKRMVAWAMRELRRRQNKLEKKGLAGQQQPCIDAKDVQAAFPGTPMAVIRQRLTELCHCQQMRGGAYQLREGTHIHTEPELRKQVTPDMACAAERTAAGAAALAVLGVRHADELAGVAHEKLKLAISMLQDDRDTRAAAATLERAMWSQPWLLTDNYVSCIREQRGQLNLQGPADPLGSGRGYSYLKVERKVPYGLAGMPKREAGSITGTTADLRKLSMEKAAEFLRKFGLRDDEITPLGRWERIRLVRELSTASTADGVEGGVSALFARQQRANVQQQHAAVSEQANKIFERQLALLHAKDKDSGAPGHPPMDVTAAQGEEEEEAAAAAAAGKAGGPASGKAAASSTPPGKSKVSKGKAAQQGEEDEEDEEAEMQRLRASGLLSDGGGGGAGGGGGTAGKAGAAAGGGDAGSKVKFVLEAKPGERRLRRTIHYAQPDGSRVTRELIFTDRERILLLCSLYTGQHKDQPGFGMRTIRERGVQATEHIVIEAGNGLPKLNIKMKVAAPPMVKVKPGKRTKETGVRCSACGQHGHSKANRKRCPKWRETHGLPPASPRSADEDEGADEAGVGEDDEDAELEAMLDGGGSPTLSRRTKSPGAKKRKATMPEDASFPKKARRGTAGVPAGIGGGGAWGLAPAPSLSRAAATKRSGGASARKHLNQKLLQRVLAAVKRLPKAYPFRDAVNKKQVDDYNQFVDPADEMYLGKIAKKVSSNKYTSGADFRADLMQIYLNAKKYNEPEKGGKHGGPVLIDSAAALIEEGDRVLDELAEDIAYAEARVEEEAALRTQAAIAGGGGGGMIGEGGAAEQWVCCTRCGKWRNVSHAVHAATVQAEAQEGDQEAPWYCEMNWERPDASCADMDDWAFAQQQDAAGGGGEGDDEDVEAL